MNIFVLNNVYPIDECLPACFRHFSFAHSGIIAYLCPTDSSSRNINDMKRILFVCLGNICRSAAAEEIMRHLLLQEGKEHRVEVDSAGILAYHQGEQADPRMRAHATRRGYDITHLSRPVVTDDFYRFDLLIGMDDSNIDALREKAPDVETQQKVRRMTDYCRHKTADHVPDPYYGGAQGFENVLDILEDACEGLLSTL